MSGLLLALLLGVAQDSLFAEFVQAQQAFAADPKSEDRIVALVSVLYRLEQNDRAIALLEPFVKANPDAFRAKLFLALGFSRTEKYDQGRSLAAQVAARLPADYYAHHVLALSLFGLNRFDESEASFKRVIEINPGFADAHFELGLLYSRQPDTLEQARASFERALHAGYAKPETHKSLGSVAIKLGRYAEAVNQLRTALESSPEYAEAYFLLADALRKSGLAEESAEAMKRFQSLNAAAAEKKQRETRSQGLYQQGMDLLSKDDLGKAYEAFKGAVEISPQLDSAHYRMAQIDYLTGNNRRALQSIRLALQLNPFEPEFYFVLSRCLEDTDVQGALDAATKAVSLNPAVADFHNLAGMLFDKTSDYRRAAESYRRAVELEPRNEAFQANLAAAIKKLKEL